MAFLDGLVIIRGLSCLENRDTSLDLFTAAGGGRAELLAEVRVKIKLEERIGLHWVLQRTLLGSCATPSRTRGALTLPVRERAGRLGHVASPPSRPKMIVRPFY